MAVDKNLFLYDLAVVTIMKNEAPYVKEWLDYHLLAGVNHFYIYDNDSEDNLKEVLQSYIDKEIVTYIFYPGKARQYEAYNDAVQNYRFFCRYMTFIDADEFVFPKNNKGIVEVVDEILLDKPKAAGLAVNIHNFGSNYLERADYSRGVLERFPRRSSDKKITTVKTIANPRRVDYFFNPHFAIFFNNLYPVNERGESVQSYFSDPPSAEKIVMNHYSLKSREEYEKKVVRGAADYVYNIYQQHPFAHMYNEEFDDEILKYRESREKFSIESKIEIRERIMTSLNENLLAVSPKNFPKDFLKHKVETFLTCFEVCEKLQITLGDRPLSTYALFWIYQSLQQKNPVEDWLLIFSALPKILRAPQSMTENIRKICIEIIPLIIEFLRTHVQDNTAFYDWKTISELKNLSEMLKTLDAYGKKK